MKASESFQGSDHPIQTACTLAKEAAAHILSLLGPSPDPLARQRVLIAFRHAILPVKRPGRRRKEGITAAHRDWKNGMGRVELYRKHIPGWESHSQWRRKVEARRLMDAIRSRERRERSTRT
jgi:hypothetical protein